MKTESQFFFTKFLSTKEEEICPLSWFRPNSADDAISNCDFLFSQHLSLWTRIYRVGSRRWVKASQLVNLKMIVSSMGSISLLSSPFLTLLFEIMILSCLTLQFPLSLDLSSGRKFPSTLFRELWASDDVCVFFFPLTLYPENVPSICRETRNLTDWWCFSRKG